MAPQTTLSSRRAATHPTSSVWLAVVVLLVLAVCASSLGAPATVVLGFPLLQAVVLGAWVLAPQRDGSWTLLTVAMTAVAVLGLLVLPWMTEREREVGPPALLPVSDGADIEGAREGGK